MSAAEIRVKLAEDEPVVPEPKPTELVIQNQPTKTTYTEGEKFMEGDHSPETIREELRRLTAEGFLTSQQGEAVPPEVPAAFFASELGRQLLAAREVHREFKFSILMPAADYGPGLEGEEVLLQGVVDCWFDGLEGITVLDFKSDRIRPGGEAARGEEYRPQLEAYSRALERITGRRVAHRILWFFATGTGLEL